MPEQERISVEYNRDTEAFVLRLTTEKHGDRSIAHPHRGPVFPRAGLVWFQSACKMQYADVARRLEPAAARDQAKQCRRPMTG
jgi:hypothetical protein